MKKYLEILKFKFQTSLAFRTEVIIWVILDLLPFFLLFIVYGSIFAGHDSIKGITFSSVVFFYVIVSVLQRITSTHFEDWRCQEIRNGKVDFFFLKPFSLLKDIFFSDIAVKIFDFIMFLPFFSLFLIIAVFQFGLTIPTFGFLALLQFLLLVLISYVCQIFIAMFIVLLTFWFEASDGLQHFKWIALNLFSGSFVPREFMPSWLARATNSLPFKYMYLIPIEILQGKYTLTLSDIIYACGFLIGLFVLVKFVLGRAIYTYSSHGG